MAQYIGSRPWNDGDGTRTFDVYGYTDTESGLTACLHCQRYIEPNDAPVYYTDLYEQDGDTVSHCDDCGERLSHFYIGCDDINQSQEDEGEGYEL